MFVEEDSCGVGGGAELHVRPGSGSTCLSRHLNRLLLGSESHLNQGVRHLEHHQACAVAEAVSVTSDEHGTTTSQ